MKKFLLPLLAVFSLIDLQAQVTQINSNKSLEFEYPLSNTKSIFVSQVDNTIWVSDGTLAGTIQLSATITFDNTLGSTAFLNGKMFFSGTTAALGSELYITDGTPAGTTLVKDINPGVSGSLPGSEAALLNGFVYFTAVTPLEGRELWRTDGTLAGTTLVKDIVPGALPSNTDGDYNLFSSGSYLLFAASTPSNGVELWKSDGTNAGTSVLMDINAGADSSNPRDFYLLNSTVLFAAKDATHGDEIWRTDGTPGGTTILKDINPGIGSSTSADIEIAPGFTTPVSIFTNFHNFNNQAYFRVFDGTSTGEIWKTDGTTANTALLKDVITSPATVFPPPNISLTILTVVNLPNKFIFSVSDGAGTRNELWESDGTGANTKLFKGFDGNGPLFVFISLNFTSLQFPNNQSLFQGNKFFFMAKTAAAGEELWISDGTLANTQMVKDINPGIPDGIALSSFSYLYTSGALFFSADNGTNGVELWKSDGTSAGTSMVADIVTGAGGSDAQVNPFWLTNGKVLFKANNGDAVETDLYAVDGTFSPLPVKLLDFTVTPKSADAVLNWRTSQEINSKNYTIQRSFDGRNFESVGTVAASGTSTNEKAYSFIDAGIINSGKSIVYYRLVSNDMDGKSSYSPVITLKLKGAGKWNVRLLGNPVSDNIKVVLSGITENVQLTVVDMYGKKLYSNLFPAVNGQISIPAANLVRGTYTLLTETINERKIIQFIK